MEISLKSMPINFFNQIHHLIRYFVIAHIIIFVAYTKQWNDSIVFFLIGPPLHLAYFAKSFLVQYLPFIPESSMKVNQFGFLLPMTLLYGGLIGFLTKHLWNEKGGIKFLSLIGLFAFLIYIHYLSGNSILSYVVSQP